MFNMSHKKQKTKKNVGDLSVNAHLLHGMAMTMSLAALVFLTLAAQEEQSLARPALSYVTEKTVASSPVAKGTQRSTPMVDRLSERLHSSATEVSMESIVNALDMRAALMTKSAFVSLSDSEGTIIATGSFVIGENPSWLTLETAYGKATTVIDREQVRMAIVNFVSPHISAPVHCVLHSIVPVEEGKEGYAKGVTDGCIVKDGVTFNLEDALEDVLNAFETGTPVSIGLSDARGTFYNSTGQDLGALQLLGSGKSNFKGSPWARIQNVKKGINDHLNNLVIPTDAEFAFNSTLGGPVTQSRGWHMALGIFEGGELRPTPGGGICQTSTTMFRAALAAGFPITEQASHSLFVTYYEKYGVGQDATIFPGFRDLKFKNDTGHPLFTQAYIDGEDVYINIYGTPDGRSVEMAGPYFRENAPKTVQYKNRDLYGNEIGWVRRIMKADGTANEETFISRYKAIPQYIKKRWAKDDVAFESVTPVRHVDM